MTLALAESRNRFLFELHDMPLSELTLWEAWARYQHDPPPPPETSPDVAKAQIKGILACL